jgi:hypothetical protein
MKRKWPIRCAMPTWMDWRKLLGISVIILVVPAGIRTNISWIRAWEVTAMPNRSVLTCIKCIYGYNSVSDNKAMGKNKRENYACNKPWRPIGMWGVEAPTFSRQSAHRWRWGCQPYAPAALYPQEDSWYSFSGPHDHSVPGRIKSTEKSNDLIGNRTRDLPACRMVPQPTTLPRVSEVIGRINY